jgi:hypothetical protein
MKIKAAPLPFETSSLLSNRLANSWEVFVVLPLQ